MGELARTLSATASQGLSGNSQTGARTRDRHCLPTEHCVLETKRYLPEKQQSRGQFLDKEKKIQRKIMYKRSLNLVQGNMKITGQGILQTETEIQVRGGESRDTQTAAVKSPGGLVKAPLAGPHLLRSSVSRSGGGPKNLHFQQMPR